MPVVPPLVLAAGTSVWAPGAGARVADALVAGGASLTAVSDKMRCVRWPRACVLFVVRYLVLDVANGGVGQSAS